jgi:hypothetical protein
VRGSTEYSFHLRPSGAWDLRIGVLAISGDGVGDGLVRRGPGTLLVGVKAVGHRVGGAPASPLGRTLGRALGRVSARGPGACELGAGGPDSSESVPAAWSGGSDLIADTRSRRGQQVTSIVMTISAPSGSSWSLATRASASVVPVAGAGGQVRGFPVRYRLCPARRGHEIHASRPPTGRSQTDVGDIGYGRGGRGPADVGTGV